MKPFQELNLLDDFLFSVASQDMEFCRHMLQKILGKKIVSIKRHEPQKEVKTLPELRGIRLDLLIVDSEGTVYNVEVQIKNTRNLPKRSRFYQGLIDMPLLISGEEDFNHLNDTYLIIISPFDLFGEGRYRYTFENRCVENPDLALADGATRIFLNTHGVITDGVEPELITFLKYVEHTRDELLEQSDDEDLSYICQYVRQLKSSREIGVAYMQSWEKERMLRSEGKAAGKAEGKAESVITLLQAYGSVPDKIRERILSETDSAHLNRWLLCAAKASSIEDFLEKEREDFAGF